MNHIKPFKICGNIYFVGTEPASSHLIATEEGLILLDSGYPHTLHHVIESIWELGFDLRDIRYVIHSHGHYDHLGATGHLLELTHAETFLGADDIDYANGTLDLTWARELGFAYTGLERLKRERVDVPLGNHVQCNDTLGKAARIGPDTGNPFIAPEEWIPFLDACAERLRKQIAAEQESRPV